MSSGRGPLIRESHSRSRRRVNALRGLLYTCGAIAGGFTCAIILLLAGSPVAVFGAEVGITLAMAAAIASPILALPPLRSRMPQRRSLIPREVALQPGWRGPASFGYRMGLGTETFLPAPTAHLLAVVVLSGSAGVVGGAAIGVGWGVGRSISYWFVAHGGRNVPLSPLASGVNELLIWTGTILLSAMMILSLWMFGT